MNFNGVIKLNNVCKLLNDIRKCPALYLGNNSLLLLQAFLNGYLLEKAQTDRESCIFMDCFQKYVEDWYDSKTTHSWAHLIIINNSEDTAMKCFYEILDKYISEGQWNEMSPEERYRRFIGPESELGNEIKD